SKELPELTHADFVISANTLAQLPLIPMEHLWTTGLYTDCELEALASNMVEGHIAWLRSFACPSALITDLFWLFHKEVKTWEGAFPGKISHFSHGMFLDNKTSCSEKNF
ncbi:MAG: hypothetical protein J0653_00355, partial [Deltaproteobacteria bacterium]|nr:hypothetical protein [Deltaproteobacteria bacterium]